MKDVALAEVVDFFRIDASLKLDAKRRAALGQYMTPVPDQPVHGEPVLENTRRPAGPRSGRGGRISHRRVRRTDLRGGVRLALIGIRLL